MTSKLDPKHYDIKRKDVEFLANTALEFVQLTPKDSVYEAISRHLSQLCPGAVVVCCSIATPPPVQKAEAIAGLGPLEDRVRDLLGNLTANFHLPIPKEILAHLKTGRPYQQPVDIHALSSGVLPKIVAKTLESLLKLTSVWYIGFNREGTLLGLAALFLRGKIQLPDSEVLEAYIHQAAIAIQRNRADKKLCASEERFRGMAERSFNAMFEATPEGVITYVSPAIESIAGYTVEEITNRDIGPLMVPKYRPKLEKNLRKLSQKEPIRSDILALTRKDGTEAHIEVSASPVIKDDKVVGIQGAIRDLSHQKDLESQLLHVQKMQAVGKLAGGIAHDFNNLLTGILGYSSFLKSKAIEDESIAEAAGVIEKAATRAAELTQQLLGFARKGKISHVTIDLNGVIQDVTDLLKRTIPKKVRIVWRLNPEAVYTLGDATQLQQVVMNLAINAVDAFKEGGDLIFSTELKPLDTFSPVDGNQADLLDTQPTGWAVLKVKDTGTGIPSHIQQKIFDPFFTTKKQGQGSGLGLATVFGIVTNHGGGIRLESQMGSGSVFSVFLPSYRAAPSKKEVEAPPQKARSGNIRLLVVDDEKLVRRLLKRILGNLGYEVSQCTNGQEAVDKVIGNKEDYDLIILDQTMPVMDGATCFRRLKKERPDIQVLLSSGHGLDNLGQQLIDEGALGFLPKPYDFNKVSDIVAKALGAKAK